MIRCAGSLQEAAVVHSQPVGKRAQLREIQLYTTRIIKGGALLNDMRTLVTAWDGTADCTESLLKRGVLGHVSRKRARDVIERVFIPRYVRSEPPHLWRPLGLLEVGGWTLEEMRPVHLYAAVTSDPLLRDLSRELIEPKYSLGQLDIDVNDVVAFLGHCPRDRFPNGGWSQDTTIRVAQGALSAFRDLGVLSGAVNKRIEAAILPVATFALLAMARHEVGRRGMGVLQDPIWGLFHMSETSIEKMFMEAHQRGFLAYHAAGSLIRVDYPADTLEDHARALAEGLH